MTSLREGEPPKSPVYSPPQNAALQYPPLATCFGGAKLNDAWGPLDVDDNSVPMVAYLDLRGSYRLSDNITLFSAIDNVTNVPPPVYPSTTGAIGTGNGTIYDAIGRMFRAGIRLRY